MAKIKKTVSGNRLNKNAYIAMLALESYGFTGDYSVTSMYRSKELNKDVGGVSDSLHLYGNAIDIGVQPGDSQDLIEQTKTEAGKKWLKDFNIYYEDETDKPGAPHHHFGFKDVSDISKRPKLIVKYNDSSSSFILLSLDNFPLSLSISLSTL